jgi:hypothetical protein
VIVNFKLPSEPLIVAERMRSVLCRPYKDVDATPRGVSRVQIGQGSKVSVDSSSPGHIYLQGLIYCYPSLPPVHCSTITLLHPSWLSTTPLTP